jgi:hypothetical protein
MSETFDGLMLKPSADRRGSALESALLSKWTPLGVTAVMVAGIAAAATRSGAGFFLALAIGGLILDWSGRTLRELYETAYPGITEEHGLATRGWFTWQNFQLPGVAKDERVRADPRLLTMSRTHTLVLGIVAAGLAIGLVVLAGRTG